mgnify:CR=1 FL=1
MPPPPRPPIAMLTAGTLEQTKTSSPTLRLGGAAVGVGAVKRLQGNLKLSISDGGKGFHATFDSVARKTKRCTNKHGNK